MDDYKETLKEKLREIFSLAKYKEVKAIICAGDIFDAPSVSNGILLEFAEVFKESPVDIYSTAGNHDIFSYNLDTYNRTSLRILELIVPQLQVINDHHDIKLLEDETNTVALSFQPYNHEIDKNGFGYSPGREIDGTFKIHTAHGMLLDHDPKVFDRYTYVGTVETEADLVLTGHDHLGFGRYDRADGKTFLNCGAVCRLSASEAEIERTVEVALITVEDNTLKDIELIPLQSAKQGDEVLDRSKIEAEQKRAYAMEEFSSLIQDKQGNAAIVDVNSIVEAIAEKEKYKPEIVNLALEKIAEAREEMKV